MTCQQVLRTFFVMHRKFVDQGRTGFIEANHLDLFAVATKLATTLSSALIAVMSQK